MPAGSPDRQPAQRSVSSENQRAKRQRREAVVQALLASDPKVVFPRLFKRHGDKLNGPAIRVLLQTIVHHGAYEHAIELLRTAIREGKAEPWMYEALALVLKMAGRPDKEVEEALLSAADSIEDSPTSLARVADQLIAFKRYRAALNLLQRAGALAPRQAEPFEKALVLAIRVNDPDALQWAACHILKNAWPERHFELHFRAHAAVAEMKRRLIRQGHPQRAEQLAAAVARADQRDLVINVSWEGDADVDIRVVEPPGTECSPLRKRTPAGGVLVRDGVGDGGTETYICPEAFPGTYQVFTRCVWGQVRGDRIRIEVVKWEGTEDEVREVYYGTVGQPDPIVIELDHGRRRELADVPMLHIKETSSGARSITLISPVAKLDQLLASRRTSDADVRYKGPRQLYQFALGSAVAYQPFPTFVLDGAYLATQAVISADRRYVRLSLAPSFTNIIGERRFPVIATFR